MQRYERYGMIDDTMCSVVDAPSYTNLLNIDQSEYVLLIHIAVDHDVDHLLQTVCMRTIRKALQIICTFHCSNCSLFFLYKELGIPGTLSFQLMQYLGYSTQHSVNPKLILTA